jgi:capsular polysaccharide transport system permease protein
VNRPLLAFPVVTALDTVIARFLLQALSGFAVAVIILFAILAIFDDPIALDVKPLALGFFLAITLGLGVGLVNCWLFAISRSWELIWGIISRPLFLVSCVFFSFASVPEFVRDVLWFNPLVHLVGSFREGIYPTYDAAHVSPAFVLGIVLVLVTTGLIAIRSSATRLATP